jgi:hypothetical protein
MMDLVRLMLVTQTSFMVKRIHDKKYAKTFEDTMLSIIKVSSDFSDVKSFSHEFELIKRSLSTNKSNFIVSLFNDKHKYVDLALELTENIIDSVNIRFIEGGSKAFLNLFDVKGEIC